MGGREVEGEIGTEIKRENREIEGDREVKGEIGTEIKRENGRGVERD